MEKLIYVYDRVHVKQVMDWIQKRISKIKGNKPFLQIKEFFQRYQTTKRKLFMKHEVTFSTEILHRAEQMKQLKVTHLG